MITKAQKHEAKLYGVVRCPMCDASVVYREFVGHYYSVHADLPRRYEQLHEMLKEHYR